MKVIELRKLLEGMPDAADVMVVDREDSCAHIRATDTYVLRDGTLMLYMDDLIQTV